MKKTIFSAAVLVAVALFACKKGDLTKYDCTGVTPTYTKDIEPIFTASCALSGCHDAATKEKGFDLSSYAGSKAAAASDDLLGSIEHASGYTAMPQGSSKLPDAQIKLISCWISNGTPE